MNKDAYIIVIYKQIGIFEEPLYWYYTEPFPKGWFWVKEETKLSEQLEYFQGIESTKQEMLEYLEKKFSFFKDKDKIKYFTIF